MAVREPAEDLSVFCWLLGVVGETVDLVLVVEEDRVEVTMAVEVEVLEDMVELEDMVDELDAEEVEEAPFPV